MTPSMNRDPGWRQRKLFDRRPLLYELGPEGLIVTFDAPVRPAPESSDLTTTIRVEESFEQDRVLAEIGALRRRGLLVTCESSVGGQVLLDLSVALLVSVLGARRQVEHALVEIAGELATSRTAARSLLLVGAPDDLAPSGLARAVRTTEVRDAVATLRDQETTDTAVVIFPGAVTDEEDLEQDLRSLRSLEAVVVLGATARASSVVLAPEAEGRPATLYLRHVPSPPAAPRHLDRLPRAGTRIDKRGVVVVNVLGKTEILGVEGSLERRPKLSELVVYLAMHPDGAGTRAWTSALWPDRRVPPQTVANRLSEARRLLGFALDDRARLRRNGERHLVVETTTDWGLFCDLAGAPKDPSSWRRALELVRGRPFDDLHQGQWTIFEGFVGEIEQAVAECALRYGERALELGDADEAVFSAQRALRAAPFDERLHRLLMRAADASGSRAGVEETLRNLALMLEIDGDPLAHVHPKTAALYAELVGSPEHR